jgi:hypothetical protein
MPNPCEWSRLREALWTGAAVVSLPAGATASAPAGSESDGFQTTMHFLLIKPDTMPIQIPT